MSDAVLGRLVFCFWWLTTAFLVIAVTGVITASCIIIAGATSLQHVEKTRFTKADGDRLEREIFSNRAEVLENRKRNAAIMHRLECLERNQGGSK